MKVICDYTRNFNKDCLDDTELQVGDAVYYLAPSSTYSSRKSVNTEKKDIPGRNLIRLFGRCKLTLADGAVVDYNEVFESRERVLAYIVNDLRTSIIGNRMAIQTLQREIDTCERLLRMYQGYSGKTEYKYNRKNEETIYNPDAHADNGSSGTEQKDYYCLLTLCSLRASSEKA